MLPDYGKLPAFELTDQAGGSFTREELEGKVWVANLMFTRCAGQCPMMHGRMEKLAEALAHPGLRLASFSVDPAYDTPEVLNRYAKRWKAQPGEWFFVTGQAGDVERLAREGFRLSAEEGGGNTATHSVRLALIDRQAHVRGTYDAEDPKAIRQLAIDAARILAQSI
jgi:protein SCO1/2